MPAPSRAAAAETEASPPGAWSRRLAASERVVAAVTDGAAALLLIGIVGLIAVQVVGRKWFSFSFTGVEELARLLVVWVTFAYLGRSYRSGAFVRMQAVVNRLPFLGRVGVEIVERGVALAFAGLLGWQGWQFTRFQWEIGRVSSTSLHLPAWIMALSIPVGCVLFALAVVTRSPWRDARERPEIPEIE